MCVESIQGIANGIFYLCTLEEVSIGICCYGKSVWNIYPLWDKFLIHLAQGSILAAH